jgi:PAS domain S-box-containing protein
MKQTLMAAFAAALATLLFGGLISFRSIGTLSENERKVAHTHELLGRLTEALSIVQDAETGQRGYILTGQEQSLLPYHSALLRIGDVFDELEELVEDNPRQLERLRRLRRLAEEKLEFVALAIALRSRPGTGFEDAVRMVQSQRGEAKMNEIRDLTATMRAEESALLEQRAEQSHASAGNAFVVLPVVTGASVLLLGLLTTLSWRELEERRRVAANLQEAKEKLEERVRVRTAELYGEVRDRAHAEEEARYSEQRYRTLVETTTAIVWNTPPSGEFETEQPGWSAFTGQSFDQLRGWGWLDAVHPADRVATAQAWVSAVSEGKAYQVEHRLRRHDGVYRRMSVRGVPLHRTQGTPREWIGVHADVDAQHQAETALREAKNAAEAANQAKSDFLANISHEIRTPMNGILGMAELLLDTPMAEEQLDHVAIVKTSAEALLVIINDLLDFSKIEAGKLELDPQPFELRDCIAETVKLFDVRAGDKGLTLSCRLAADLPSRAVGDSGRLRQILVNLLGNALKFTAQGEVGVTVGIERQSEHDFHLVGAVRDTGVGIPPDKLRSIFEPFTQADGSVTRRYGGTGLGLSISVRLIELMGGRIWVESALGGGSTFHFTAHLGHAAADVVAAAQPAAEKVQVLNESAAPTRPLDILVAEDIPINQAVIRRMLEKQGHAVTLVGDGKQAVAAARGRNFDIILMDVQMPDMGGLEATTAIRTDENGRPSVPIIALTAHALPEDRHRCLAAGMDGYLTKPIQADELWEVIGRLSEAEIHASTKSGPPRSTVREAPWSGTTASVFSPVLDQAATLALYRGDKAFIATIAALVLQEAPAMLALP